MSQSQGQAWIKSKAVAPNVAPSDELELRLLKELGSRVWLPGFTYPLLMAVIGWQTTVPQDHPWIFWAGSALSIIGAIWRTLAAQQAMVATDQWKPIRDEVRVSSVLLTSLWCLLFCLGLNEYARIDFALMLLFGLLAWAGIGANVFSPDLSLAQIYIHLNMVPAMLWSILLWDRFGIVMPALFAVVWVSFGLLAKRSHLHLRGMLQAQIELEAQAAQLSLAKARAEDAFHARTQFLANISHEIRTPLNGVLGVADLMVETPLDEEQQELIAIMTQSGQHLMALVNDLLDLSKINAGKLVIEAVEFDPRRILEEVSRPMQLAAEAKGLDWHVRIRKEVPHFCIGDPARVRQILTNLMSNALKFTSHGGVTVNVGMMDGQQMRFVIEDTGIGIEAEKLFGIFEEFEQADQSSTRRFGGTGLGLAISKKLIEIMGGRIGVESSVGQGSMFWFELGVGR